VLRAAIDPRQAFTEDRRRRLNQRRRR
jgi:hypothetical protein